MRNMTDMKNAFGKADDAFVNNVYRTLSDIQLNKDRKPAKKIYFSLAAAIIIVCVLSAGTVLALSNTWGFLDFLSGRRADVKVLPEASGVVQEEVPQQGNQTDFAAFVIREAVYDGQSVYIVLDVKPSSPEYLLLGPDTQPYDHISNLGPIFSRETGTIADYAQVNHKVMMNTTVGISGANCSIDYLLEEDGTLVYMIDARYGGNSSTPVVELKCVALPFVVENGKYTRDMDGKKSTMLSATLKNTGTQQKVTGTESAVYSDCGVRVDKITLKGSAMSTYVEIEFTVVDANKYAESDGIFFEFLDRYGEPIPNGAGSGGGIEAIDNIRFTEKNSLQAMEKLPSEVILRGYSYSDKTKYETHTFKMK